MPVFLPSLIKYMILIIIVIKNKQTNKQKTNKKPQNKTNKKHVELMLGISSLLYFRLFYFRWLDPC